MAEGAHPRRPCWRDQPTHRVPASRIHHARKVSWIDAVRIDYNDLANPQATEVLREQEAHSAYADDRNPSFPKDRLAGRAEEADLTVEPWIRGIVSTIWEPALIVSLQDRSPQLRVENACRRRPSRYHRPP